MDNTEQPEQFANEQPEHWLTVKQAASFLNISERGVQLKAQRGKIESRREGDRLYVRLRSPSIGNSEQPEQKTDSRTNAEQDTNKRFANKELIEALRIRNQEKDKQIDWLQRQIETHQTNEAELRRLMMADKNELQELRRKVSLSIQQEAQEAPSAPRSATELANVEDHTPGADKPSLWWHRVMMKWRG